MALKIVTYKKVYKRGKNSNGNKITVKCFNNDVRLMHLKGTEERLNKLTLYLGTC